MISGFSWARRFSSWWKLDFSSVHGLLLMETLVALSIGCWTRLRAKSFCSCYFLTHVQIANNQYHLLLFRVPWHILQPPPYANQTIRAFEILSFPPFFQLENQFFANAGSALDEVNIPFWSAYKQVWQQAASLLSSWCNHLNRSNHVVWNDLLVGFLLPPAKDYLIRLRRLNLYRAELCLCRFEFASYCCGWLHIIFISGLFFDSDCSFDHTRLCVTSAWFYTRQKCSVLVFDASSNISTANWNSYPLVDETGPSKWHHRCVVFNRLYVDIFSTNVGRTAVLG